MIIAAMQALILTFLESLGCLLFFDIFLLKRIEKKWLNGIFFGLLIIGFFSISLMTIDSYIIKIIVTLFVIIITMSFYYKITIFQILFLSIAYYTLLFSLDYIMVLIFQYYVSENIWENLIQATIWALLCKCILLLSVIILSRIIKKDGILNQIKNKEWIRFIFFPVVTIISLAGFTIGGIGNANTILFISFGLVITNFLIYFIIRDIVKQEKTIQNIRLSQERSKNHMNMYLYISESYREQKKKVHDFKNHIDCIYELLSTKSYDSADKYVNNICNYLKIEMNYIETNHAIINAVINQKYKLAKTKDINIILKLNDLRNVWIKDEDLVVILSNMLDNAIEACEKITGRKREIVFKCLLLETEFNIFLKNPVKDNIKIVNNKLISTKSNPSEHGIGMTNIEEAVRKYKGECIYNCDNGFFTYMIVIRNQ